MLRNSEEFVECAVSHRVARLKNCFLLFVHVEQVLVDSFLHFHQQRFLFSSFSQAEQEATDSVFQSDRKLFLTLVRLGCDLRLSWQNFLSLWRLFGAVSFAWLLMLLSGGRFGTWVKLLDIFNWA